MREHLRAGLDELRRLGISGHLEHGGKHPRLVFTVHERPVAMVCAGSPRCVGKAAKLVRRDVRRAVEGRAG